MTVALSLGLCYLTYLILRGGWRTSRGRLRIDFSMNALIMAALSIAAAMFFFGPITGLALVAIIAIHEFGHVAAFRICGHDDATFRLIPLMGGVASSAKRPDGPLQQYFISIMGPAICIAPTILALSLVYGNYDMPPMLREFLWDFGIFSGTINFFNLLPIGPLDGGKISHILFEIFWPKAAKPFGMVMMGIALLVGIYMQSIFIILLTLMSLPNVTQPPPYILARKPTKRQGAMLLGTYLVSAATLLWAGIPLLAYYLR
ncbi:hypothetical protein GCM10007939_00150 [Amylibacter marinus]|uniref:Peptidase M50 domain-containing protein n=1 Tax=Amylibacter marinus TaxID=1475483 RepID=A0ABQ5VQQ3_9RHOB|nr:site-2 protease family protein [Amylibacter marinus]GLQ33732.1 hypothetical protein GCM10007939_00150 [Amylibacter marinus]